MADHSGLLEEDGLIKIGEDQRLGQTQEQFSALRELQADNGLRSCHCAENHVHAEQELVPPDKGGGRKAGQCPARLRAVLRGPQHPTEIGGIQV